MGAYDNQHETLIKEIEKGGQNCRDALGKLYQDKQILKRVINYVKFNGGNEEEAFSVFAEALIILERNIRYNKYKYASNLSTYLLGIVKHCWLQEKRKKKPETESVSLPIPEKPDYQNPELIYLSKELQLKLNELLNHIGTKCKQLMVYWSQSYTYEEIAQLMDLGNVQNVRKQKFYCKSKILDTLKQNPELIPEIYHG